MRSPLSFLQRGSAARTASADGALITSIRKHSGQLKSEHDRILRARADDLRGVRQFACDRLEGEFLIECFALVVEAARRSLGITLFDVQLIGGLQLARGRVAEMQTGEGKTYTALLPAFAWSRAGRGLHVATSSAWLAERDCDELKPVYEILGTSVGLVKSNDDSQGKQSAYQSDVTYAPGYELGFDYLRDRVALRPDPAAPLGTDFLRILRSSPGIDERLQRTLAGAVIDEVDNVLIDEACSPLLLAENDQPAEDTAAHHAACRLADDLAPGEHCQIHAAANVVQLTSPGQTLIWRNRETLPLKSLLRPWETYVVQALRAKHLIFRDVHYVVKDEKVVIVDESTGRLFEERNWRDGLHQAVEARAGVTVTSEKRPLARISRQGFFRRYNRLCGMTGTAVDSTYEFREFYHLPVAQIPTNRPCQRKVESPRFYHSTEARWEAVAREAQNINDSGQPLLIGTRSIAASEQIAERLEACGVDFQMLNGRQDKDEAEVVAAAGQSGMVTIATNMAGRGTDIKPDDDALQRGGLCVISTEPHESRRVDRQLIGRAARQGQPGRVMSFVSADDALITQHGDWLSQSMRRMATDESGEIHSDLARPLRRIQARAERVRFRQRRQTFYQETQRDSELNRLSGDAS